MIDVQKLKNTIDELENHSFAIARVTDLYNTLEVLKADLASLSHSISKNTEKLKNSERNLNDAIESIKKCVDNMPSEMAALQEGISKGNDEARQVIISGFENTKANQKQMIESAVKDVHALLAKQKSDIEVALRSEGAQIQRGLENVVNEKHHLQHSLLNNGLAAISAENAKQRKYLFVSIALASINVILLLSIGLWMTKL